MKTKEERQAFYKQLREDWKEAKQEAEDKKENIYRILQKHNLEVSLNAFCFVSKQMENQGLEGIPYLDMKTFNKWKESGFKVKKGEKSKVRSIVWKDFDKDGEKQVFPKVYSLFHKSQVIIM